MLFLMTNVFYVFNSFCSDEGHLFTCGDNSFGQLGTGDNQSYNLPVEVLFFASKHVEEIACGMRHTLALVTGKSYFFKSVFMVYN